MSTYSECETRVKRRLGRRGMNITTEFLDEMQIAQEELERMGALPKWLKKTTPNETTLEDAVILVNLPPSDFIRVYDDQALVFDDIDGVEKLAVRLDTRNQLISKKNAGISGGIFWFQVSKTIIEIAPALPRDTVFRLTYYAKDTVLDGGNENLWVAEAPELISGVAGYNLSCWLRDDRGKQYFQELTGRARRSLVNQIESDEWGDQDLTMGGPD